MHDITIDTDLIQTAVAGWLEQNSNVFTLSGSISTHIDDLLSSIGTPQQLYELSLKAYQHLIVKSLGINAKPVLIFPLKPLSTQLLTSVPHTLEDLKSQLDDFEPPSLYLLSWQPSRSIAPCEEYHTPLSFSLLEVQEYIYIYYREFRYKIGINNNWEFSRAIYLEYYPEGMITQ